MEIFILFVFLMGADGNAIAVESAEFSSYGECSDAARHVERTSNVRATCVSAGRR